MKKSDEIREKIRKKEEQIEKRKKTTEKFEKKLEKCTDERDRRWVEDDIKTSNGKLKELEGQLERLQEQLEKQLNKENVPLIPAIESLLDRWEEKTREYIGFCHEENIGRRDAYCESLDFMEKEMGLWRQTYHSFHYDYKYRRKKIDELKDKYTSQEGRFKVSDEVFEKMKETYQYEEAYENFCNENAIFLGLYGDEEKTDRFMRDQKEIRRIELIERVTKVVGEIKDASGLHFGYDDGINGIIIGNKGKAKVHCVMAGGWNIQRFHYRVLVHPIKEKDSLDKKVSAAKGKVVGGSGMKSVEFER